MRVPGLRSMTVIADTSGARMVEPDAAYKRKQDTVRRLLAAALLCLGLLGCSQQAQRPQPVAYGGVLDLSDWDFAKDGPLPLNGEWQLYWQKFASDIGSGAQPMLAKPGAWNSLVPGGQQLGPHGFGTYRLRILLPKNAPTLRLRSGSWNTATRIRIDGLQYSIGTPGPTRALTKAKIDTLLLDFPSAKPEVQLTVEVSNFLHRNGGLMAPPILGAAADVQSMADQASYSNAMVFAAMLMFGLYHLVLFAIRRDPIALWFGAFCLLASTRLLIVDERILHVWITTPDFETERLTQYLIVSFAVVCYAFLVRSIFPKHFPTWTRNTLATAGLGLALLALASMDSLVRIFEVVVATVVASVFLSLIAAVRAVFDRERTALTFLGGFIPLGAGIVADVIISTTRSIPSGFSAYGMLGFSAMQSIVIARRFGYAFRQVESLSTELEARNRELDTKNADLARVDALKNDFLANTSHELRTPLHGIIGIAESLLSQRAAHSTSATDKRLNENLNLIATSGRRLASLVNDILDMQQIERGEVELNRRAFDLHTLSATVTQIHSALLPADGVRLINDVPDNLPLALGDENRVQQVLHNLIGNAVKFTSKGTIRVFAEPKGELLEISVTDTGIGIEPQKQRIIFERFTQADGSVQRTFGGTGLGLAITSRLIEMHGGKIHLESKPGHGSRFWFTLPLAAADSTVTIPKATYVESDNKATLSAGILTQSPDGGLQALTDGTAAAEPDPSTSTERTAVANIMADADGSAGTVLVVDDELTNRRVLENILGAHRYRVVEAADGEQALALLQDLRPDVVLLDVMMPRMSGYEVCRAIRRTNSPAELPVLFLSARTEAEDLLAGFEAGGNDYLPKPFSGPELLARVRTHTSLRAFYAEALRLRGKLVGQEKLAMVGQMASGIVHDFKNPVSVIRGYAEMADSEELGRQKRQKYLNIIGDEAERMANMVQDLLDYSSGGLSLRPEQIALEDFARKVEEVLTPYFRLSDVEFNVTFEGEGTIRVDTQRMLRAIINIAGNAIDALKNQGSFQIRVLCKPRELQLLLLDNGPGIDPAVRETLFEPFVTHGKAHGSGLGMAIVRSIVEGHGGTVTVDSKAGKGATFNIQIPR